MSVYLIIIKGGITYPGVPLVVLGVLHVGVESHAPGGRGVDSAHHADGAVRLWDELLAEEPDGLGRVRDREVPGGESAFI